MFIKRFSELSKDDANIAGGKGASLGEMTQAGIAVPPGFVLLTDAFDRFLEETDINIEIDSILHEVKHDEVHTVEKASEEIQALILSAQMPDDIAEQVQKHFAELDAQFVAVRSSATAEDGSTAAWAGQLDSFLNTTEETLLENVKKCWASLFTPRAIFYRFEKDMHGQHISVAVVVQKMVQSEVSGIAFTVHPVTEDHNQLIIEAALGLGEAIVSGQITPDSYVVEKEPRRIIDKNVITQERGLFKASDGGNEWKDISEAEGEKQVIDDEGILRLTEALLNIENHYGFPCDIEFAMENGEFYIVQSRPITTLSTAAEDSKKKALALNFDEWEFEFQQRDGHPLIMADQWCQSIHHNFMEELRLDAKPYDYIFTNDCKAYVKKQDKASVMQRFIAEVEKQDYLNYVFEYTMRRVDEFGAFADKVSKSLPDSNEDILKTWQEFNQVFARLIPWFYIPYYLSEQDILTNKVKEGLAQYKEALEQVTDFNNALALLCFPVKKNKLQEEQEHLYRLVDMAATNENHINDSAFNALAEEYLDKFAWTKTFIELPKELLSRDELLEKVVESLQSGFKEEFELQRSQKEKNSQIVKDLTAVIEDDPGLLKKIDNARHLGWLLSASVENSLESLAKLIPFYKQIARTIGMDYQDWVHFTIDEISRQLKGEQLDISLKQRKTGYVYIMEQGEVKMLFGEEALDCTEDIDKTINKVDTNQSEISGSPTSPGKVKGKAKICMSPDETDKVEKGDVLVCAMTSPDYVPAMKRAAAIVTDEGGLLSHAAIISRELNKPCIVGTRVASRVLHDGDEVEVDAERGVVRIIEKNIHIDKIKYEDIFNHDFPLILAQINNQSESIRDIPWSDEPFTFHPHCIHARLEDGMLHYLYDVEGMEWKRQQAGKFNKEECIRESYKHYDKIKDIVENEKALSREELKEFWENLKNFWVWFDCFYWMIEFYEKEDQKMDDLLKLRKDTEYIVPGSSAALRNTIASLFPEKSEFVDVISYEEAVSGTLPSDEVLKARKKQFAYTDQKLFSTAEEAMEEYNIELKKEAVDGKELTGQIAYKGKASGKVRIIRKRKDIASFSEGDILVASSTTPDFLPAIKKSAAIVSEHGGAISHAAITSRELQIPCIVGVKGATQVLKDGDEVEVDAERGLVTILKRA